MTPENAYYIMATVAFPVGAFWGLLQWYATVKQRKKELRWKQAEAAWKLLDEIFEDPGAGVVFDLIDGERDTIDIPGEGQVSVSLDDALKALDPTSTETSNVARMLRRSFDCTLYAFDRLEVAISSGYILEEDVNSPTIYYSKRLYLLWSNLEPYAREAGYQRAINIIERLAGESLIEGCH